MVLNEAIVFNDVVYYIAFMVEGQADMVLAYEVRRGRDGALGGVQRTNGDQLYQRAWE